MIDAKLKEVVLPESGYKVFIATRLTFGEYNKINNVMIQEAKGEVSLTGQVTPTFDGNAYIKFNETRLLTIVKMILSDKGEDLGVSMDVINELPCEDGEILDKECNEVIEEIKKKSSKKVIR